MRDSSVVVVGGGLLGASIAWGLARGGETVTVLDEGDIALRAARANFGLVWVQGKGLGKPCYSVWTRASAKLWPELADELKRTTGVDPGLSQPGGFMLRLSEMEMERGLEAMAKLQSQLGPDAYDYEVLDHRETKARLPDIGPDVVGSVYCQLDGHVNPLRLFHAFHIGLARFGVDYRPNSRVERIRHQGGLFTLEGAWGSVEAPKIVLAAGVGNAALAPLVGLDVALVPSRGQIIVTERTKPFLHHPVGNLRQTDEGGVIIGESKEARADHQRPRAPVTAVLAHRASRMFPLLGRLNVVRVWAAFRVMTADGFPVYQQSRSHPGAFAVACHSGVTLAANHAFTIAGHIATGTIPASLDPFSGDRFHVSAAA
jgi:glycine/D-amino acid oxidase-like deaminating enzyme